MVGKASGFSVSYEFYSVLRWYDEDITDLFYKRVSFPDTVVFDPLWEVGRLLERPSSWGVGLLVETLIPFQLTWLERH